MSTHEPPIDIDPVAATRDKARAAAKDAASGSFQAPSFGKKAAKTAKDAQDAAQNVAQAAVIGKKAKPAKKPNLVGGAVQTVAGGALMLVGVPMLILPGPGLVAIGGGAALAVGGIKKIIGSR